MNVEYLSGSADRHLWRDVCERVAAGYRESWWDPPHWILPDNRHRAAAQQALLLQSGQHAISTSRLHTLLSCAADLLKLPLLDVTVGTPEAVLALQELLASKPPESYRDSADSPGFAAAFWAALEDTESRGYFPDEVLPAAQGHAPPAAFLELQRQVHESLKKRGFYTAGEIMRRARAALLESRTEAEPPRWMYLGPFFSPSALEREFIDALLMRCEDARVITTPGSHWTRDPLNVSGEAQPIPSPACKISLQCPLTPEAEINAVFTLIAGWAAAGRLSYGDVRIVSPALAERMPTLESSAGRYRVPIRGRVTRDLSSSPEALQLLRLLDLFVQQWERSRVLELLRSRLIDAPFEQISAAIRKVLKSGFRRQDPPGQFWLDLCESIEAPEVAGSFSKLQQIDLQGAGRQTGKEFSSWLEACLSFLQDAGADKGDSGSPPSVGEKGWRALERMVQAFGLYFPGPAPRSHLIETFKKALRSCSYEADGRETDAVEICPAAREDHLPVPVVIHLGLDSHFPSQRRMSPFFDEEISSRYDEQFRLFQTQLCNAAEEVVLSCPSYDDDGTKLALSPFFSSLDAWLGGPLPDKDVITWPIHALPRRAAPKLGARKRPIQDARVSKPDALAFLQSQNRQWSPTRLDNAIQCRYLHFARYILKLEPREDQFVEGITPLILGSLAHDALNLYFENKKTGKPFDLESWVRNEYARRTAFLDPHPESDRSLEELARSLQEFIQGGGEELISGFQPKELEFCFIDPAGQRGWVIDMPTGSLRLHGRIDRWDEGPADQVIVIEYKYRKAETRGREEFLEEFRSGLMPQLPLYGYFMMEAWNKSPVALLQIHLRANAAYGLKFEGFDLPEAMRKGSKVGEMTIEDRARIIANAVAVLQSKVEEVSRGEIRPKPRDSNRCGAGSCTYADLCRYRLRWMGGEP